MRWGDGLGSGFVLGSGLGFSLVLRLEFRVRVSIAARVWGSFRVMLRFGVRVRDRAFKCLLRNAYTKQVFLVFCMLCHWFSIICQFKPHGAEHD